MTEATIDQAKQLLLQDKKLEAGRLLAAFLQGMPTNAEAWYFLAQCVEVEEQQIDCLQRALRYRSDYAEAQTALMQATGITSEPEEQSDEPKAAMRSVMSSTHPNEEFSEKPTFETIPVEKVTPIVQIISLPQADKAIESATLESNKFGAVAQPAVKTLNSSASSQKKVRSNPAGESTQKMAAWYAGENRVQRMFTFVFWGAMIICVPLMFIFPSSSIKLLLFALVMYCIIDFILKKEKQSKKLKATYAKGAKGEIEIGQILAQLGGDFAVWHDVAGKYGNFDHVVLSKSGQLFMIETKANGGRVRVVGEKILINNYEPDKNMIRQCTSNWMALRDTVQARTGKTVFVIPLLVFTNAFVERSKPVKSIRIINKKFLKQAIYENCRGKVDRTHLWDDLAALDRLFSQKNLTYKEFARRDFEAISSWSK